MFTNTWLRHVYIRDEYVFFGGGALFHIRTLIKIPSRWPKKWLNSNHKIEKYKSFTETSFPVEWGLNISQLVFFILLNLGAVAKEDNMVFVEIFVAATIAVVVAVEAYLLKKICNGEELSYLTPGQLFVTRGQALALISSTKWNANRREADILSLADRAICYRQTGSNCTDGFLNTNFWKKRRFHQSLRRSVRQNVYST